MATIADRPHHTRWSMARVIIASSAGTAFEWYDFFIFGSLAPVISKVFFAGLDPTPALLAALALFAAGFAFRPLGALIFGVIGDRLPRRAVMIAGDTASFAVRATMGALLVAGHARIWELIALQACGGAAVAFYNPAFYGLVREIVPNDSLQRANGYLAIARYAAFPLGAATGGTIVAVIGPGTALLVAIVGSAVFAGRRLRARLLPGATGANSVFIFVAS